MLYMFALLILTSLPASANACHTVLQNVPNYAMEDDFTCGIACLRSVMDYIRGEKTTEIQILDHTGSDGATPPLAEGLRQALFLHNLQSKWQKHETLEGIRGYMLNGESVIANMTLDGNFRRVVIKEIGPEGVTVMDPLQARYGQDRFLTLSEFDKAWRILVGQAWERGDILRVSRNPIR